MRGRLGNRSGEEPGGSEGLQVWRLWRGFAVPRGSGHLGFGDFGFRVEGLGIEDFRAEGLGFWVQGLGFRV